MRTKMYLEFKLRSPVPRPPRRRQRSALRRDSTAFSLVRVLVLAHQIEDTIQQGSAADYADVAQQLGFSRARVSQIVSLTSLAPSIQEFILTAHVTADPELLVRLSERKLRPVAAELDWSKQRAMLHAIKAERSDILLGVDAQAGKQSDVQAVACAENRAG